MFVLDSSGSIRNERFEYVRSLVLSVVESLEVRLDRTRVGVIVYSDTALLVYRLNQYTILQDMITAIQMIKFYGQETNTASALSLLCDVAFKPENGDRAGVPNIAIVVTDGNSNINRQQTVNQSIMCRQQGVRLMTASMGNFLNLVEINMIASQPLNLNVHVSPNYTIRDQLVKDLINGTCDGNFHLFRFSNL